MSPAEKVHASHTRHPDIRDKKGYGFSFQDFEGFPGTPGSADTNSSGQQAGFQNRQDVRIIIHDQDGLPRRRGLVQAPVFQGEETPCLRS